MKSLPVLVLSLVASIGTLAAAPNAKAGPMPEVNVLCEFTLKPLFGVKLASDVYGNVEVHIGGPRLNLHTTSTLVTSAIQTRVDVGIGYYVAVGSFSKGAYISLRDVKWAPESSKQNIGFQGVYVDGGGNITNLTCKYI